jgi:hypothetical protein
VFVEVDGDGDRVWTKAEATKRRRDGCIRLMDACWTRLHYILLFDFT